MNEISVNQLLSRMREMTEQAQGNALPPIEPGGEKKEFADLLSQSINAVNTLQQHAAAGAQAVERGDPGADLTSVVISMQKAGIAFETLTQVRNRMVSAYQDIMNMPI